MKIQIKHRITNEILLEGEYKSLKDCLENNRGANLGGANLRGADLGGANLREADLRRANLREADLGGAYLGGANVRGAKIKINQVEDIIKALNIKIEGGNYEVD